VKVGSMETISIVPIENGDIHDAAKVVARAFAPSPFTMAMSRDKEKSEQGMSRVFKVMFRYFPGQVFVAKEGGHVVGVMRMVEWPRCQMTPLQAMRLLPTMFSMGPGAGLRTMKGRGTWAKHDPKEPHWHLDPLTVVPERQGQGIGTRLLSEFCSRVDKTGLAAYLETDRPENVRLYERFGFKVTREITVIGVPCWFMWRAPQQKTTD